MSSGMLPKEAPR